MPPLSSASLNLAYPRSDCLLLSYLYLTFCTVKSTSLKLTFGPIYPHNFLF